MPRAAAKSSKLKSVNGKLVSAKSKTGDPACSAAMSDWKTSGMTSAIAAILGKCRAKAKQNKTAEKQQASGKLAQGRGTWQRSDKAKALAEARKAKQAQAAPPAVRTPERPSLRTQAEAHRRDKGSEWRRAGEIVARLHKDAKLAKSRASAAEKKGDAAKATREKADAVRLMARAEKLYPKLPGASSRDIIDPGPPKTSALPKPPRPASLDRPKAAPKPATEADIEGIYKGLAAKHGGQVPIHEVRAAVAAKHGPASASPAVFDPMLKRMRADGKLRLIAVSDGRDFTEKQHRDSIPGMNETLGYIAPKQANDFAPTSARAKGRGTLDRLELAKKLRKERAAGKKGFGLEAGKAEGRRRPEFLDNKTISQKGRTPLFADDMPRDSLPGQTSMFSSTSRNLAGKPITTADGKPHKGIAVRPAAVAKAAEGKPARDPAKRKATADKLRSLRSEVKAAKVDPASHTDHAPGHVGMVNTDLIHVDPERFQYKLAPGAGGATGSLSGVKKWDADLAGVVQVWKDPANGKTYVVNGHNRAHLASQLGVKQVTARFISAKTADEARAKGALTNIAEGRGNAMDAAKFFRDEGVDRAGLEARGIPLREKIATEGLALSHLEKGLFNKVVQGEIPHERAVIIGGAGLSHEQQRALHTLSEKHGRSVSNDTLRELTDTVKSSATKATTTQSLFGDDVEYQSLAIHKAALQAHVKQRLSTEKKLFGTVSKAKAAANLERGGNTIDAAKSGAISREAAEALDVFDRLKNLSGPVSARLNAAAEKLHSGAKAKKVQDELYAEILKEIPNAYKF